MPCTPPSFIHLPLEIFTLTLAKDKNYLHIRYAITGFLKSAFVIKCEVALLTNRFVVTTHRWVELGDHTQAFATAGRGESAAPVHTFAPLAGQPESKRQCQPWKTQPPSFPATELGTLTASQPASGMSTNKNGANTPPFHYKTKQAQYK